MPSEQTESETRPPRKTVTVAIPDLSLRGRLSKLLKRTDIAVESVAATPSLREALEGRADVVVVRRSQLTPRGFELRTDDRPAIIVVDEDDDPADRARLVAAGATGVLDVDSTDDELSAAVQDLAIAELSGGWARPDGTAAGGEPRLSDFRSRSTRMRAFLAMVERIKDSDSTLLITGETGVGKERLARAIHADSHRRDGPFVSVNCGALPPSLLESELFGHEKGAFTGADRRKAGRFELAHGGTIFLDEIGEMSKHLQVDLLTVLQRREVRRLGADRPLPIDVRVMAATHNDLGSAIEAGTFRQDLFYRLNVVPLVVPPLRMRVEDLPDLIGAFVRHLRRPLRRESVRGFRDEALGAMLRHPWPGNVRELHNIVERAMLLCTDDWISLRDLPEELGGAVPAASAASPAVHTERGPGTFPSAWLDMPIRDAREQVLADFERSYLVEQLRRSGGRINDTARRAGLHVRSLHDKMKKYDLRKADFREG